MIKFLYIFFYIKENRFKGFVLEFRVKFIILCAM